MFCMYYVYSLKCRKEFYIGCTNDLKERIKTYCWLCYGYKSRLPVKLEFYLAFKDKNIAFKFEKYLKSGSGRVFIKKHFVLDGK